MKHLLAASALALVSFYPVSAVQAQSSSAEIHAGSLDLALNKSQILTADRPIDRAMIGNDEIADILPVSDRSVYVLGKAMGTTSLTLYDRANRVIAIMDISVGPDIAALQTQISEIMPGEAIQARLTNGKLMLTGSVSDPGMASRAHRIAEAYAGDDVINMLGVVSSQQVMLEVRFAEVNRTVGERLGVSGFAGSFGGDFRAAQGRGASAVPGQNGIGADLVIDPILESFGIFSALFEIGDVDIEAFLNVLEREGLSKTLAEPTLVALSGERASFLAGGEFPVPVAQAGAGGGAQAITVEFKPFGVSLGFTPTVLGDRTINLIVEPEVSSIDPSASVTINGLTVPGLQTRRAATTVELRDGESFVLAGLLRTEYQTSVQQLPILGSLPIIGSLFRSSQFQKGETELLIVVTPRLVKPIRPDQVRLPTDRVADPDAAETLLLGQAYKPRELPPVVPAPQSADNGTTEYEY